MERKILIISIFITLSAIAFLSGYLLTPEGSSKSQTGLLTERFNSNIDVKSSEDKIPKTLPISSRKFLSFVNPFTNSQKIVAVDNSGDIVEIDTVTLNEKIAYTGLTGIVEALVSPTGDSLVYSFYDSGNNKKHAYLNFKKGESTSIAGNLKSTAFSPSGNQIAYLISRSQASGIDDGAELLISKGIDIIKRVIKTRLSATAISWSPNFISIVSYDKDGYGDLFILKDSGELNKILSHQYDLGVKWSPSSEKMVFSMKNNIGSDLLFYKDIKSNSPVIALDINTNISKCVWPSEREVICGVKNQAQLKDEFYRVNLSDSSKTLVLTPSINLLTKELALNRSEDTLFVLNDIDSKLYALKIQISDNYK